MKYYKLLNIHLLLCLFALVLSVTAQAQEDQAFKLWERGNSQLDNNDQEAINVLRASIDIKESKHADHDLAIANYNLGDIAAAIEWCSRGLKCDYIFSTGHTAEEINGYIRDLQEEIGQQFAPLKIRLRGVRMTSLARIDSIDYRFDLQALNPKQRLVLRRIEEGKSLQMTGIGEDGSLFCEIPYFPVLQETVSGRISSYTLEISPDRRYRFDFNLSNYKDFVLDIDWQKEFVAVESIPPNYIKIITPAKYYFVPEIVRGDSAEVMQGIIEKREKQVGDENESGVYYLPLPEEKTSQVTLRMTGSTEKSSERTMDIIAKVCFIAGGISLISLVR